MLFNALPPICWNLGGLLRSPALNENLALRVQYAYPENVVGCGLMYSRHDLRKRARIGDVGAPSRQGERTCLSFGFSLRLLRNKNRVGVQVGSHALETED
jgi:hypothetical protein